MVSDHSINISVCQTNYIFVYYPIFVKLAVMSHGAYCAVGNYSVTSLVFYKIITTV